MRTATTEYSDFTVRIPRGADTQPLKAFVEAMGWNYVVPTITVDIPAVERHDAGQSADSSKPSKRLRGIFKMANSTDFDYKEELYKSLKGKYEQ